MVPQGRPSAPSSVSAEQESSDLDKHQILQWYVEARDIVARDQQVDLSKLSAEIVGEREIATHARTSLLGALSHDLSNADFAESLLSLIHISEPTRPY